MSASATTTKKLFKGRVAEVYVEKFCQQYGELIPFDDRGPDIVLHLTSKKTTEKFLQDIGYNSSSTSKRPPRAAAQKALTNMQHIENECYVVIEVKCENAQLSKQQRNSEKYIQNYLQNQSVRNKENQENTQDILSKNIMTLRATISLPEHNGQNKILATFSNWDSGGHSQRGKLSQIDLTPLEPVIPAYHNAANIGAYGEEIAVPQFYESQGWSSLTTIKKNNGQGIDNIFIRKLASDDEYEYEIRFVETKTTQCNRVGRLSKAQKTREHWIRNIVVEAAHTKAYTEQSQQIARTIIHLSRNSKTKHSYEVAHAHYDENAAMGDDQLDAPTTQPVKISHWQTPENSKTNPASSFSDIREAKRHPRREFAQEENRVLRGLTFK